MKTIIATLLSVAVLFAGSFTVFAGDSEFSKLPAVEEPAFLPVQHDELWIDGFASYNFAGSNDPWSYGVGATFFPNGGAIGVGLDYSISPESAVNDAHVVNASLTYRMHLTDNIDAYASGLAGYNVSTIDFNALPNVEFDSLFSYGARAGIRYAPLPDANLAFFSDFGRTWVDGGRPYNSVRAGLSFFF